MYRSLFLVLGVSATISAEFPPGIDENFFKADTKSLAAACADKAWVIDHKSGRYLAEYGRAYLAAGERSRAEDAFRRAAAAAGPDAEVHRLIASAWLHFGQKPEALAAYDTMQKADPKARRTFVKAACELVSAGFEKEALVLMEKAWKLEPREWSTAVNFGKAALQSRKPELAHIWFRKALEISPRNERLWTDLALAYTEASLGPSGGKP